VTESLLRSIPRELLEANGVFPLPPGAGSKTGVIDVVCVWDPNDVARRAQAESAIRPHLEGARLTFFQPIRPDAKEYLLALLAVRYRDQPAAPPDPAPGGCDFCKAANKDRLFASANGSRICGECARSEGDSALPGTNCTLCRGTEGVRLLAGKSGCRACLEFARAILGDRPDAGS